jgi:hypothetical protein
VEGAVLAMAMTITIAALMRKHWVVRNRLGQRGEHPTERGNETTYPMNCDKRRGRQQGMGRGIGRRKGKGKVLHVIPKGDMLSLMLFFCSGRSKFIR